MTLVIMAAGMGSRFGGLKQIEPVDENENFIIDYSIYDAIKVGFKKIVFVIKEENYSIFKDTVGKRIEKYIDVSYVFQKSDMLTNEQINLRGGKPLGTLQAVLCTKDFVDGKFCVINSDDFYGRDSFQKMYDFLNSSNNWGLIGYKVSNTLTENGSVKRGVCKIENDKLVGIEESVLGKIDGKIVAKSLNTSNEFFVQEDTIVSMNFFGFDNTFFDFASDYFNDFIKNGECLLPTFVCDLINKNKISVSVINTNSVWYGVTYKEDKENVVNGIKKLVESGVYPSNLWEM